MNISIFASIWARNLWDELILKNEIELLKEEFWKNTQFQVASYEVKNPVFHIENTWYFEYFPFGIKNPRNFVRNIQNLWKFIWILIWSDIVVIWWWGIIYDSEIQAVKNPLNQWIFRTYLARFFRRKIYFYAIGIDIKKEENFQKLEKIFKNVWKITVRDEKSQEQLEKIGLKSKIIDDPVMREDEEKGIILWVHNVKSFIPKDFEKYDFQGKKVWLALRSWYIWKSWKERIERLLIEELCRYIEKQGWKIIFLPHSLHKMDMKANDYEFMKQFVNYERYIYANIWEVYTAYNHKMIDVIISMRLHSIILSYTYGIDQIVLSYCQKTDELIKKLKN